MPCQTYPIQTFGINPQGQKRHELGGGEQKIIFFLSIKYSRILGHLLYDIMFAYVENGRDMLN